MDKGREPLIVLQGLVGFYRDLLIAKSAPTRDDLVAITAPTWAEMTKFAQTLAAAQLLASQQKLQSAEVQVKNTTQPRLWLEITLTGLLPSALGAAASLASEWAGQASVRVPTAIVPPPLVPPPIASPPAVSPPRPASPSLPPTSSPPAAPLPADAPAASPAVSPSEGMTDPDANG